MKSLLSIFLIIPLFLCGQALRENDKIRILEAVTIADVYGESLWKGVHKIPFSMILITEDLEYLLYHDNPTEDFKLLNYDSVLNTNIYYRQRQFDKRLLATFPAINNTNCIVVGTPENTNKSSSEWIITLLHEHFHQYTYAAKNYNEAVNNLDLSNGDRTGMWMLNYKFPYQNPKVIETYTAYVAALKAALLQEAQKETFKTALEHYRNKRADFKASLAPSDYRYFSFQLWQEGIARYTEYKFLELLKDYKPSKAVRELEDFIPFSELYKTHKTKALNQLTKLSLSKDKRVCFYAVGMIEGLLLDLQNPNWHSQYLNQKFYLEHYTKHP